MSSFLCWLLAYTLRSTLPISNECVMIFCQLFQLPVPSTPKELKLKISLSVSITFAYNMEEKTLSFSDTDENPPLVCFATGVSFGATRELAFLRASSLENGDKVKIYFPQTNNGVFSFGRDVNILFKHGINALPEEEQDGKGYVGFFSSHVLFSRLSFAQTSSKCNITYYQPNQHYPLGPGRGGKRGRRLSAFARE